MLEFAPESKEYEPLAQRVHLCGPGSGLNVPGWHAVQVTLAETPSTVDDAAWSCRQKPGAQSRQAEPALRAAVVATLLLNKNVLLCGVEQLVAFLARHLSSSGVQ